MDEVHGALIELVIFQENLISKELEDKAEEANHEDEEHEEPHDVVIEDELNELDYLPDLVVEPDHLCQFECHAW